jgi:hypothetical protein
VDHGMNDVTEMRAWYVNITSSLKEQLK